MKYCLSWDTRMVAEQPIGGDPPLELQNADSFLRAWRPSGNQHAPLPTASAVIDSTLKLVAYANGAVGAGIELVSRECIHTTTSCRPLQIHASVTGMTAYSLDRALV